MTYKEKVLDELEQWEHSFRLRRNYFESKSKWVQNFSRKIMPDKLVHFLNLTTKKMIELFMDGSQFILALDSPPAQNKLEHCDKNAAKLFRSYKKTAVIEGGITGGFGFLIGLADFPMLLSIQIKFLFDCAHIYGYNTFEPAERLFLLHIFQLAYSSKEYQIKIFNIIYNWNKNSKYRQEIDWDKLAIEYKDNMDFVKIMQLIPILGAPVGVISNSKLMDTLKTTAINSFRLRRLNSYELIY